MTAPLDLASARKIVEGRHGDPFSVLGQHTLPDGSQCVRVFRPNVDTVDVLSFDNLHVLGRLTPVENAPCLFDGVLPGITGRYDYRLRLSNADAARMVQLASWRPGARVVLVDLDPVLNDAGRARRVVQARASDDLQVGAIPGHADDVRVRFDAKAPPPDDPSSDDPPSATSPHEPPPGAEPEGSRAVEPGDAGPNAPGQHAIPSNSPVTTSSSTTGADAPTGQLALGFGDDPASG